MTNREVIEKLVTAFDKDDTEEILLHMADNIQWHMPADDKVYDKQSIEKMFIEHPMKIVNITKDNFIVEGNSASVNGEVTCRDVKTGKEYNMYYCDVYELTDGKVSKMVSYTVEKKV